MAGVATVTAAEIARLADVERAAVSNWRRRHSDFPAPVGGSEAKPLFALAEVERWLTANGKLQSVPVEDRVWQELRLQAEERRVVDVLADVAAFLCFAESDGMWRSMASLSDVSLADRLPGALAEFVTTKRIPGGVPFPDGLAPEQLTPWRLMADEPSRRLFEELHSRYVDSTARTVAVTSLELAALIASLAPPVVDGAVLDPACGSGTLLRALGKKQGTGGTGYGQERDPALARIAWYRLQWCGAGEEIVKQGDSLRDDGFPCSPGSERGAKLIVCDPPTGDRNWGHEDLGHDPRWEFGLPPRAESELAWVEHCYAHLRPGGTAIVVMPIAAASRRSGRRIRGEMLRRGALRQVVALPPGLAAVHSLGLHLWILARPSVGRIDEEGEIAGALAPARSVHMVDGSRFSRERLRTIEGEFWHHFADEPGVTADVPVVELLDDDVDLTPSRYVRRPEDDLAEAYATSATELPSMLSVLFRAIPERLPRTFPTANWPTVTVAELARSGALHVVLNREIPRTQVDLRRGDILVSVLDPTEPPLVLRDAHDHGLDGPTPDRHLIRCDPEMLDPYFVAGFLRGPGNLRQAVTATGGFRYDVRRARIPRLSLDEQRRYGATFRRLAEFAELLRQVAVVGDDVVRLAHDGLTTGLFDPVDSHPEGE